MAVTERRRADVQTLRRLTILGWPTNQTNGILLRELRLRGVDVELLSPRRALAALGAADLALGRLDIRADLAGVEPGLLALLRLERRGVRVLNRPSGLLGAHDKLRTARLLDAEGVPHPRTVHLASADEVLRTELPCVLKPRFGSWGRCVFRCEERRDLARALESIRELPWFRRQGVLAQELLPETHEDLRVVIARGTVVGAALRVAAPGEWRTNVSLGGTLEPAEPPPEALALAHRAAAAIGADVVGADLFPTRRGYVVLELNGSADFDSRYSLPGRDVHDDLLEAISLAGDQRPQGVH